MTKANVPAVALLPLRLFFGITFLYAGLDKLLDPTFFDASAPTSLHAQLEAFARLSPLGELIRATLPLAGPIGLAIAVGEIAIGIGTLTGLAFRLAAAAGAATSLLFFLTASWGTHPYYLGNDLPYLFGWVTLAIAGHGDLLVPRQILALGAEEPDGSDSRIRSPGDPFHPRTAGRSRRRRLAAREAARSSRGEVGIGYGASAGRRDAWPDDEVASPERRALLQTGLLAGVAAIVASLALPLRAMGVLSEHGAGGASPVPNPSPDPAPGASPTPAVVVAPTPSVPAGAMAIAKVSEVKRSGATSFTVPFDAPASLPAGDPGVIVQLADGSFVAFDATCTHAGCTVEWDRPDRLLVCPCHSAVYDPAHDAEVLGGPAPAPLTKLPIVVDQASGQIYLQG